jgi:glycosyltransferase involved in cell wall biosynthesis
VRVRILEVTQVYYPYLEKGGPVETVKALASHLAARGHQVTVLTADLGPRDPAVAAADDNRVEVIYLPAWLRYRTATLSPGVLTFCSRRLAEFDVVHIYGLYDLLGVVVAWFCRRQGIPYVVEPLGAFQPRVRSLGKKRLYHWTAGRRLLHGAARIVVTSEHEGAELLSADIPAAHLVLRRNGLDLSEFEDLPRRGAFRVRLGIGDEPLVLFLGRISLVKGLDLLVEAFKGMSKSALLAIVGPDDRDGCLVAIRKQAGERVRLLDPLYGRDKLEALVDADVFVLPSRYESFGNAAAEAVVCGTPVMVTDQCGVAPLLKDRVGLVVPCTVEGIRDGLSRLLSDEALRQSLRARCPEVAQELSWDEPVALMESVYNEVVAEARDAR